MEDGNLILDKNNNVFLFKDGEFIHIEKKDISPVEGDIQVFKPVIRTK